MTKRTCDLCEADAFEPLAWRDRDGQPLATVVCQTCGLVSHAEIPSAEELAHYYAALYRQEYQREYAPSPRRVVREWRRGRQLVARLKPSVLPGSRVLEVGSGIGCTVMNFTLAGYDACGIEPGEGFSHYSRSVLHARVEATRLEDLALTSDYDLVLLVHVLEHLPAPTAALRHIARLLGPRGKLYVEVPNFGLPHAAPGKQFHHAHIYNFTPATLRMLAAKCGFRVERIISRPGERVIGLLLAKDSANCWRLDPTSYAQTIAACERYSVWGYYLRPEYLAERLVIAATHLGERLFGERSLRRIVAQCQQLPPAPERYGYEPVPQQLQHA